MSIEVTLYYLILTNNEVPMVLLVLLCSYGCCYENIGYLLITSTLSCVYSTINKNYTLAFIFRG